MKLAELSGEEWMDDGLLTPEEKVLIEQRLAVHERNPNAAVSWALAEEKLQARYGQ